MAKKKGVRIISNEELLKKLLDAYVEVEDDRPDTAAYAQRDMARFRKLRREVLRCMGRTRA